MIAAILGAVNTEVEILEGVLNHVAEQGILTVLQTGNLVSSPTPREVIACLAASEVVLVQGEADRHVARFARKSSRRGAEDTLETADLRKVLDSISSTQLEWLHHLPRRRHLEIDGVRFALCHGAPGAQREAIRRDLPATRFERLRELEPVDILICGGAPETFSKRVGETLICGIGPLRGTSGAIEWAMLSTEGETPALDVMFL